MFTLKVGQYKTTGKHCRTELTSFRKNERLISTVNFGKIMTPITLIRTVSLGDLFIND